MYGLKPKMVRLVSNQQIRPTLSLHEECFTSAKVKDKSIHYPNHSPYHCDYLSDSSCIRMAEQRITVKALTHYIRNRNKIQLSSIYELHCFHTHYNFLQYCNNFFNSLYIDKDFHFCVQRVKSFIVEPQISVTEKRLL